MFKITSSTTLQDVFNHVVFSLRRQGKPAFEVVNNGYESVIRCRYRTNEGTACAAGHVIADSEYKPHIEGSGIAGVICNLPQSMITKWVRNTEPRGEALLIELQGAHDSAGAQHILSDPAVWMKRFLTKAGNIAQAFGLSDALTLPDALKVGTLDFATATKQDVFDFVAFTLIQQGKPAWDGTKGICAYRGPDGVGCAVGKLIPDAQYVPEMECGSVRALIDRDIAKALTVAVWAKSDAVNLALLEQLQKAHDRDVGIYGPTGNWISIFRDNMFEVAKTFKLDASILLYRAPTPQIVVTEAGIPTSKKLAITPKHETIADAVTAFAAANIGLTFHLSALRDYVAKTTGHTTPDTSRRVLALLRKANKVSYTLISRPQSFYRIDAVL